MSETNKDDANKQVDGQAAPGQQGNPDDNGGTQQQSQQQAVKAPSRLALGGDEAGKGENDEVARLRADLQRHKVEEGRVKTLSDQLKAKEAELEALRQKNAEFEKAGRSMVDHVDPKLREVVDGDILRANEEMIRGSQKDMLEEVDKRVGPLQKTLETERNARIQAENESFDTRIEQLQPGFAAETNQGGKYAEKWNAFLAQVDNRTGLKNGEILTQAYFGRRVNGVNDMIDDFKRQAGISRRESMRDGAFPGKQTPYVEQGDGKSGDTKRYTFSQYKAELEESRKDYDSGRITAQDRKNVIEKFKRAVAEGRIVNDPNPQVGA